jgi:hypothetical protein
VVHHLAENHMALSVSVQVSVSITQCLRLRHRTGLGHDIGEIVVDPLIVPTGIEQT